MTTAAGGAPVGSSRALRITKALPPPRLRPVRLQRRHRFAVGPGLVRGQHPHGLARSPHLPRPDQQGGANGQGEGLAAGDQVTSPRVGSGSFCGPVQNCDAPGRTVDRLDRLYRESGFGLARADAERIGQAGHPCGAKNGIQSRLSRKVMPPVRSWMTLDLHTPRANAETSPIKVGVLRRTALIVPL